MNKKLIAVVLSGVILSGCASNAQKEAMDFNKDVIAAQIEEASKPLVELTCPDGGCTIKSLKVSNPAVASMIQTVPIPKSSGEKIVDNLFRFLPIAGQLYIQDRNGQRSLESQRINSDLTQGIISGTMMGAGNLVEQALGAVPDAPKPIFVEKPVFVDRDINTTTTNTTTNTDTTTTSTTTP